MQTVFLQLHLVAVWLAYGCCLRHCPDTCIWSSSPAAAAARFEHRLLVFHDEEGKHTLGRCAQVEVEVLAEEVATAREALAAAEAEASEGAVAAARAARLSGELSEAHAEIRRLSELEGARLLLSMRACPGTPVHDTYALRQSP